MSEEREGESHSLAGLLSIGKLPERSEYELRRDSGDERMGLGLFGPDFHERLVRKGRRTRAGFSDKEAETAVDTEAQATAILSRWTAVGEHRASFCREWEAAELELRAAQGQTAKDAASRRVHWWSRVVQFFDAEVVSIARGDTKGTAGPLARLEALAATRPQEPSLRAIWHLIRPAHIPGEPDEALPAPLLNALVVAYAFERIRPAVAWLMSQMRTRPEATLVELLEQMPEQLLDTAAEHFFLAQLVRSQGLPPDAPGRSTLFAAPDELARRREWQRERLVKALLAHRMPRALAGEGDGGVVKTVQCLFGQEHLGGAESVRRARKLLRIMPGYVENE